MPQAAAWVAVNIFTASAATAATVATVTTVSMYALAAGSMVYSMRQSKVMEKKARAAMRANEGMTLTSRDSAAQRRIIYGQMRVGGTYVFIHGERVALTIASVSHISRKTPLRYLETITTEFEGEPMETHPVALHEAAHAVIARMVGIEVVFVTIEPGACKIVDRLRPTDWSAVGAMGYRLDPKSVVAPTQLQRLAFISLAGSVGKNCLGFTRDPISPDDFEEAFAIAMRFNPTDPLAVLNGVCDLLAQIVRTDAVAEAIYRLAALIEQHGTITAEDMPKAWALVGADQLPRIGIE